LAMLAEELLMAKGIHIPTHEKAVVAAMQTLGEPPLIVGRRKARTFLTDTILEFCMNEANEQGNPEMARALKTYRGSSAWGIDFDKGYAHIQSMDPRFDNVELDVTKLSVAQLKEMLPDDLRQFLSKENEKLAGYESSVFLKAILSTGGLYRLDGGETGTQGVLDSIWGGLPFEDLPPLPYPRIWFEGRGPDGNPCPLWKGNPPDGAWNGVDAGELWGMAVAEIAQGSSWAIVAVRHKDWFYEATPLLGDGARYVQIDGDAPIMADTHRYERVDRTVLEFTPKSQDEIWVTEEHSDDRYASEAAYRGAMAAWAIVLVDLVTARNVDRRQEFWPQRRVKQMTRFAPLKRFNSTVYNVSIATATSEAKDETGRYLSVRFLVRGHWRVSDAPHAQWVDSKEATCVWVKSFVKGPPGAPWKGRPVYVEPR
jgi:hypothetical protein